MKFRALLFALVLLAAPAWAGSWNATQLQVGQTAAFTWLGADSGDQTAIPAGNCSEVLISAISGGGSPVLSFYLVDTATQTANTGTLISTIAATIRTPAQVPVAGLFIRPTVTTGASGGTVLVKCAGYAMRPGGMPVRAPIPATVDFLLPRSFLPGIIGGLDPDNSQGSWASVHAFHGSTTLLNVNTTGLAVPATVTSVAWANTNFVTRLPWVQGDTGAVAGTWAEWITNASSGPVWRGNAAGAGGFVLHVRFGFNSATATQRSFVGFNASGAGLTNADPSSYTNVIYVGNDSAATTLSVCGNDTTGSATCNALGANFPVTTGAMYDVLLWASSNGSPVSYQVTRLDSAFVSSGVLTTDLPQTTIQFNFHAGINNGATAASALLRLGQLDLFANL